MAQWEEHGPRTLVFGDKEKFISEFADYNDAADRLTYSIWANNAFEKIDELRFAAHLTWGAQRPAAANIDLHRTESRYGTSPGQFMEMIRITIAWQQASHLSFGPTFYHLFDHPLDRSRYGIGWMGWLPFTLTPADVPEAHLVLPMNGGTFIQSVPDFWQAPHLPRQPDAVRDEATIARVQDVEIRLNLLGLLPTAEDLASGNWGR